MEVGPDLGPNCLERLSADDKPPLAKKELSQLYQISGVVLNSLSETKMHEA